MSGRPSSFTQEIADEICSRLADGESLRAICRTEGMPHTATVCRWLVANDAFREQYAHAREQQADALFDDILAIADGKDDSPSEDINERRVRIDARKWMAGKLKGKYSDKTDVNVNATVAFTGLDVAIKR